MTVCKLTTIRMAKVATQSRASAHSRNDQSFKLSHPVQDRADLRPNALRQQRRPPATSAIGLGNGKQQDQRSLMALTATIKIMLPSPAPSMVRAISTRLAALSPINDRKPMMRSNSTDVADSAPSVEVSAGQPPYAKYISADRCRQPL